jgi:hypothetical protein
MKDVLFRLLVAAALTLAAFALSSSAHGQQAHEEATPTNFRPLSLHRGLQVTNATEGTLKIHPCRW